MKLQILALDPATYCGWAHTDGISGTWDLSVKKNESSGMRLVKLRRNLDKILTGNGVDLIVFEQVMTALGRRNAMVVLGEIQGTIKVWCEVNNVDYCGYSSNTIKKHATGKGNASKEKMVDAAEIKFKRPFSDDDHNECDALWLLSYAESLFGLASD